MDASTHLLFNLIIASTIPPPDYLHFLYSLYSVNQPIVVRTEMIHVSFTYFLFGRTVHILISKCSYRLSYLTIYFYVLERFVLYNNIRNFISQDRIRTCNNVTLLLLAYKRLWTVVLLGCDTVFILHLT